MGPHVAARLRSANVEVVLFNRRGASDGGVPVIKGDRREPGALRKAFANFRPDVAIDMIPFTIEDAHCLVEASRVCSSALVAISSMDVYLAYGRLHRTEVGPIIEGPISESAPLRTKLGRDGSEYDKLGVERVLIQSCETPLSILRLPMIYGPPDMRRVGEYVKRVCDGRLRIPISASYAHWRTSRASSRNCAEAIPLCALAGKPGLSVYNVAEERIYSQAEWIGKIGRILDWKGKVIEVKDTRWPPPFGIDTRQEMIVDSSRIRAELGFREIVEPEEALKEAVCWARDELDSGRRQEDVDYLKEDAILNR